MSVNIKVGTPYSSSLPFSFEPLEEEEEEEQVDVV
jgi:hypothetical protein